MKFLKIFTISYTVMLICFSVYSHVLAVSPVVTDITVTDVTPVSFCVIWNSDIASTSGLKVFTDSAGTTPVSSAAIESQPVENGDAGIAAEAENIGVMKVRVTALRANTTYFFQTETTEKGGSDVTLFPISTPLPEVTTAGDVVRTHMEDSAELPFSNDLIVYNCDVAGALLVADVAGSDHPVSGFVKDGAAATHAYVDLNNVFNFGMTLPLKGGEYIELTKFKGIQGIERFDHWLPKNTQMARMLVPLDAPLCYADIASPTGVVDLADMSAFLVDFGRTNCSGDCEGDFEPDGDVDGSDLTVIASDFGRTDCPAP